MKSLKPIKQNLWHKFPLIYNFYFKGKDNFCYGMINQHGSYSLGFCELDGDWLIYENGQYLINEKPVPYGPLNRPMYGVRPGINKTVKLSMEIGTLDDPLDPNAEDIFNEKDFSPYTLKEKFQQKVTEEVFDTTNVSIFQILIYMAMGYGIFTFLYNVIIGVASAMANRGV